MHPKVSVIMPVYRVEKYVQRAIESVLNQTLPDFELLVVDDGSPDRSGEICEELAKKDSRITVFHQKNAGAPAARNAAMEHARGEYLLFVDSDDWIEPTMLEDLYRMGSENSLELVISGFYIDTYCDADETDCFRQVLNVPTCIYSSQEEFRKSSWALFDKNQFYSPWNKLFLRSYIEDNHLRFPSTFWDDFPFVLSVIRDVERVGVTENAYYHFIRARAESETTKYRAEMYQKREEEHGWMLDLYEHWGIDDERSMEVVYRRYAERLVGCVENVTCKSANLHGKELRDAVRQMIGTPQAKLAMQKTVPHSTMMKLMLLPMKQGNVTLTCLEGKFISFVKSHSTKLFSTLKARR